MMRESGYDVDYKGFPFHSYMHKRKCIFIHIPKTAGTALASCFMDTITRDHFPQYVYQQANRELFNNYFKFSFVRNPWDRAVSMYTYLATKKPEGTVDTYFHQLFTKHIKDFNSFISYLEHNGIDQFTLFQSQSFYLLDYKNEIAVDYVGKVENMEKDYEFIKNKLSLTSSITRKNASIRKPYQSYYTPELKNRVGDLYRKDIDIFNYDF